LILDELFIILKKTYFLTPSQVALGKEDFISSCAFNFFINKELKHSFCESYIPKCNLGMSDKELTFDL